MSTNKKIALTALFLAMGYILPFLTGNLQNVGKMFLPMHFPIFLCAFICGGEYGLTLGLILPLTRSVIFGFPDISDASIMLFELGTYGIISGIFYSKSRDRNTFSVVTSLIMGMVTGRIVWGVTNTIMMGMRDEVFTYSEFARGAFIYAAPGIILQLILIPLIMNLLDRFGIIPFHR